MDSVIPRIALMAVACFALLLASCGDQRAASGGQGDLYARIIASKRVRVGVKADTPPFGMKIGDSYVGFDIDLAHALARQLGIETVEFVPVTSGDRSDLLVAGTVDMVVASMTITRYRERRVDFTIPYFQDGQALLVARESPIQSYLDLAGHRVGCVKGSTSSYYMTQVAPDCIKVEVADFAALRAALDQGGVDAITSDGVVLLGLMKSSGHADAYRLAGERFTTEPYGIAVPQDQSHWRNALNRALCELWEKGRWQQIADTWFGPGAAYETTLHFAVPVYPR